MVEVSRALGKRSDKKTPEVAKENAVLRLNHAVKLHRRVGRDDERVAMVLSTCSLSQYEPRHVAQQCTPGMAAGHLHQGRTSTGSGHILGTAAHLVRTALLSARCLSRACVTCCMRTRRRTSHSSFGALRCGVSGRLTHFLHACRTVKYKHCCVCGSGSRQGFSLHAQLRHQASAGAPLQMRTVTARLVKFAAQ